MSPVTHTDPVCRERRSPVTALCLSLPALLLALLVLCSRDTARFPSVASPGPGTEPGRPGVRCAGCTHWLGLHVTRIACDSNCM